MVSCLDTVLQYSNQNTEKNKPKIILEGFGKVGTSIAIYLRELNYKLTGISTIKGAIYDDDGLNIDELLKLKREFGGDELINQLTQMRYKHPQKRNQQLIMK